MFSPELKQRATRAANRSLFIVGPVILWLFALMLGLMDQAVWQRIAMILAVVLFFLGMPLSLLLRIDVMENYLGVVGPVAQLVAACAVVTLNFVLWTTVKFYWRRIIRIDDGSEPEQIPKAQENGTGVFKKKAED